MLSNLKRLATLHTVLSRFHRHCPRKGEVSKFQFKLFHYPQSIRGQLPHIGLKVLNILLVQKFHMESASHCFLPSRRPSGLYGPPGSLLSCPHLPVAFCCPFSLCLSSAPRAFSKVLACSRSASLSGLSHNGIP